MCQRSPRSLSGSVRVSTSPPAACGLDPAPKGARPGARGLPRRYYALTRAGQAVARAEATRLARLVALAGERDLLPEGGTT